MAHLRIGIHTSRAGCLFDSAERARLLGANTFQIFSSSPRMWKPSRPDPEDVQRFRQARERWDLFPLSIHTNYLVNLASLDPEIRAKSIEAFRGEIERAAIIGAEYLVVHPGNYKRSSAQEGMAAFVLAFEDAVRDVEAGDVTVLIENTVGAGAQLGGRLEELRTIHDLALRVCGIPVAYCLDTCHLLASGFDIASAVGLEKTVAAVERELGWDNVMVMHANDSKGPLNSHLDRHANIGKGHIGEDGFGRILRHPKLRTKPFILETPDDEEGDHRRDVETLQRLAEAVKPEKKGSKKTSGDAGKAVRISGNRK